MHRHRNRQLGWEGPATPWRSQAALGLAKLGRVQEARELAGEELALARRQGSARSVGVALRAIGRLERGPARMRRQSEAVDALESSGATLEYARALVELGVEQRRADRSAAARQLLQKGHKLAARCHATRLAELAWAELRRAGARPRRPPQAGPGALTPGERRVVELVAQGMTNRQAAQALFLTEKTVETHLGHAYAKLEIRSRRDLAGALCATDE